MAITNGKTTFCPGCPNVGNYVGEISPDSFDMTVEETHRDFTGLMPPCRVRLIATDQDGMQSNPVFSSPVMPRDVQAHIDKLNDQGIQAICDRISRCVGTTTVSVANNRYSRTDFECPAVDTSVVDKLSEEG